MHVKQIPNISIFKSFSFKHKTERIVLIMIIIALLLASKIWLPRAKATVYTPALAIMHIRPKSQVQLQNTLLVDLLDAILLCANFMNMYERAVKKALIIISKFGIILLTICLCSWDEGAVDIVNGVW